MLICKLILLLNLSGICLAYCNNTNYFPLMSSRDSKLHISLAKKRRHVPALPSLGDSTPEGDRECEKTVHVPKTKVTRSIYSYLGTNYYGFQKQIAFGEKVDETYSTIEGTLEKTLISIGAIAPEFIHKLQKLEWSKAARTDKGVHAACIVVGCRLNYFDNFLEIFNEALPDDIVCYDIFRVTKGFDARSLCTSRFYEYIFPSYLLDKFEIPPEHKEAYESCNEMVRKCSDCPRSFCYNRPPEDPGFDPPPKVQTTPRTTYQCGEDDIARLQRIFDDYIGSHNFHNFSSRVNPLNANCYRTINSIKVNRFDEMVKVSIEGQSFMLNQIRKMIGVAIEVFRGSAPEQTIKYGLNKLHSIHINTAPAQGLFLHHPDFEKYNTLRASPPQTVYIDYENVRDKAEEFISQRIYPEIYKYDQWTEWLETINEYPFYWENPTHKLIRIDRGIRDVNEVESGEIGQKDGDIPNSDNGG